jgi:hypothetical protein
VSQVWDTVYMKPTPASTRLLVQMYCTYADGHGGTVDWSGVTALGLCQCGHRVGPFLSEAEAKSELGQHRRSDHPVPLVVVKLNRCGVEECGTRPTRRGLCGTHYKAAREVWGS